MRLYEIGIDSIYCLLSIAAGSIAGVPTGTDDGGEVTRM
jgi:hypothetical protein